MSRSALPMSRAPKGAARGRRRSPPKSDRSGRHAGVRLLSGAIFAAGAFRLIRAAARAAGERAPKLKADPRLRSGWTSIRGVVGAGTLRLHARIHDDVGSHFPPVVLVPGYAVGSSYLVPLASRLVEHVRVYVPELPGHGLSDHDSRPLTVPELALALAAWMNASELHSALLVGHSLGCQVAAEVAAERPDLVAGLVLVGPTSDPEARTAARQLARGVVASIFDSPTYLMKAARDYFRAGARVLRAEMRQMITHRIEDVLAHGVVPSRVVRGGRDRVVPQRWAETVARLVGAPLPTVVVGWGHAVHYDDPEAVAHVALDLAHTLRASRNGVM